MASTIIPHQNQRVLTRNKSEEYIINYLLEMRKRGRKEISIETASKRFRKLSEYCNILNPEEVKEAISKLLWQNSTKRTLIQYLSTFYDFYKLDWNGKPNYKKENKLPFIPTEEEIDQLIASAGLTYQALLQLLKETGIRFGEAKLLKWIDLDTQRRIVSITPEKNSNPRILPISEKLVKMLGLLKKENDFIFPKKAHSYRVTFEAHRERISKRMNNPRLKQIHFHTLRHYKGTMEYHKTKDIVHVQKLLGHKDIQSTMIYINIESALWIYNEDEWTHLVTHDLQEEGKAINAGFQLVRSINETTAIYRKRK